MAFRGGDLDDASAPAWPVHVSEQRGAARAGLRSSESWGCGGGGGGVADRGCGAGDRFVTFDGIALACAEAGGFPEPELIHFNPKDFDFGKKKSFPMRDQHFFASVDKAQAVLGWQPQYGLVDGLRDSYEQVRCHPACTSREYSCPRGTGVYVGVYVQASNGIVFNAPNAPNAMHHAEAPSQTLSPSVLSERMP